ncbi:hypothetical protein ANN_27554 [Periplaneta americana]|uniref:Uncharacterized protein n=1 Tax=Periplaneta americana TaxID=6978 RepID=A0ABQ8RW92_PERAM|nr:hypothetical protein ANN_27554 [Periplaneta americana]
MSRRNDKSNTESTEEVIKRLAMEVWKDESMLRILANLVEDSLVAELKSTIEWNRVEYRGHRETSSSSSWTGREVNELEQYQRRLCLRIFGMKEEEEGENADDIAGNVAIQIGVKIDTQDIDRSKDVFAWTGVIL